MNKKFFSACLALALCIGGAYTASVFAQAKPDVLVKQRQAAMILQGKYFGPIYGMAQGKIPYDAAVVTRNAVFLDSLTQMAWDGFNPITKDEKSRTLPVVYDDTAKFNEEQNRFRGAIGKLVAAKGDEGAVKVAAAEVFKSCGSCHDSFRAK